MKQPKEINLTDEQIRALELKLDRKKLKTVSFKEVIRTIAKVKPTTNREILEARRSK